MSVDGNRVSSWRSVRRPRAPKLLDQAINALALIIIIIIRTMHVILQVCSVHAGPTYSGVMALFGARPTANWSHLIAFIGFCIEIPFTR